MGQDKLVDVDQFLTDTDRKRRMLTRDDRKYLIGEKIIEGDKKHVTRQRIRSRIAGGIRDLSFLMETGNEGMIYSGSSDYPPHALRAMVEYFLQASLQYHNDHTLERSPKTEDLMTPVESTAHLENRLEDVLPDVLSDTPYASVESVTVDINVEGTLRKKELLEEDMLNQQSIKPRKVDAWKNMGGQLDQLKSRLKKENEQVKISPERPEGEFTIISPDEK